MGNLGEGGRGGEQGVSISGVGMGWLEKNRAGWNQGEWDVNESLRGEFNNQTLI